MSRKHSHWTDEEIEYLLDHWWDKSRRNEVIKNLGRPENAVVQKFYSTLKEKGWKPKEYYAMYKDKAKSEASIPNLISFQQVATALEMPQAETQIVNETTAKPVSFVVVGSNSNSTQLESTIIPFERSKADDIPQNDPRRYVDELHAKRYPETVTEPLVSPISKFNATNEPARFVQIQPEHNQLEDTTTDESSVDIEDIPVLLASHERRIRQIEQQMNGMMTISQFAEMMRNLDEAYKEITRLQDELDRKEREKEKLENQLKREIKRIRTREDELALIMKDLEVRLSDFMDMKASDKLLHLKDFQEGLKETMEHNSRLLNRRYVSVN